jgi:hypothetical protein
MITCRLCRRVATPSLTHGWCRSCHEGAVGSWSRTEPANVLEQTAFVQKYMRILAKRMERGLTTGYCECHSRDAANSSGSQCNSYWSRMYEGRRVCDGHFKWLQQGSHFRFVGEPDPRVDRAEAYRLLAAAFEVAPDDGLREILARAIYDARNTQSKGAGTQAKEPGSGSGDGSVCQDAIFPWD